MDDDRTTLKVLNAIRSTPKFQFHAIKQGQALKSMLSDISKEDAGEIVRLIADVGFPESVESMLVSEINIGGEVLPAGTGGTLQKWGSFMNYGTQHVWDQVNVATSGDTILKVIVTFLVSIGLRHPSCPTYRVLTCLYCCIAYGEDKILSMPKEEKYQEVQHVKEYFALRRDHAPAPAEYVVVLPRKPSEFIKLYPALAPVYNGNPIVACPFDSEMVMAIAESFPLRKPKGSTYGQWGMQMPQAIVHASTGPQRDCMPGQGAFMQMMQMNGELMRQLAHDRGAKLYGRDGGEIRLEMAPPKKFPLRDLIADGPPATSLMPPALPPLVGHTAEPSVQPKLMKKKKKRKKKKAIMQTVPTTAPVPLANEPAATGNAKLTTDALGASSGVLESMLSRDHAKKEAEKAKKRDEIAKNKTERANKHKAAVLGKGDAKIAASGKGGAKIGACAKKVHAKKIAACKKKGGTPPLGCSKCRYLKHGCGQCRAWANVK